MEVNSKRAKTVALHPPKILTLLFTSSLLAGYACADDDRGQGTSPASGAGAGAVSGSGGNGMGGAGIGGGGISGSGAGGSGRGASGSSGAGAPAGGSGGASGSLPEAGSAGMPPATGCGTTPALAQGRIQMEDLCRGVVAVRSGSANFVSWRLLGYEPDEIAFNVYRGGTKLNATPIADSTNYLDQGAPADAQYTVRAVLSGTEQADSEQAGTWPQNYLTIPLDAPAGYTAGDTSVGDLDGDGSYELVVKWESMPRDNSQAGVTGTTKLDGYELDGTRLWRIELGRNIREGAHYTQFIVYDLDGDGTSEVACKTAPGTIDGLGENVLLGGDDANADYRNGDGYVLSGPEYLTVFSGKTGENLATVPFEVARGSVSAWGDEYGNRVDRFLSAVAFVEDSGRPTLIMARGYYTRATLTAWNFREGELTRIWTADSNAETAYSGQGAHAISVADVDADGRQEIVYGASTIDDDGTRLCATGEGHGDSLHVSDLVPTRPGVEVFMPHEATDSAAYTMRDGATCEILWQGPNNGGSEGPGRGVAADIDPGSPGAEAWINDAGLFAGATGAGAGSRPGSCNFLLWWDGDSSRELLDGTVVSDVDGEGQGFTAEGCSAINGSKSNPNLSADLIGDWREEVVFRCGNDLRLYTTSQPTTTRIYTLMHDPQYRAAVAWQNVAYNQPPHPSFHIGGGMAPPPRPDIHVR